MIAINEIERASDKKNAADVAIRGVRMSKAWSAYSLHVDLM